MSISSPIELAFLGTVGISLLLIVLALIPLSWVHRTSLIPRSVLERREGIGLAGGVVLMSFGLALATSLLIG